MLQTNYQYNEIVRVVQQEKMLKAVAPVKHFSALQLSNKLMPTM